MILTSYMYFIVRNKKNAQAVLQKKSKKYQKKKKNSVNHLPLLVLHRTSAKKVVWSTLARPTLRVFKQLRNFYLSNWIEHIDALSRVAQIYCCPIVSV